MYLFGAIEAVKIGIGYFILIILLPSIILGNRFKNESLDKRFMRYLVFGNSHLSALVFILAYLNLFNTLNLVLSILFTSILLSVLFNRKDLLEKILTTKEKMNQLILGEIRFKQFFARVLKNSLNDLKKLYNELFRKKKVEWFIFILIILYSAYQYGINSLEYPTYIAPDEEVHLYWIQSIIQGNIYPSGVYPHVFHTILAGIISTFRFNAMKMTLYFGITSHFLIMGMLYLGLRKLFKSKYAALLGFMFYSTLDLFFEQATYRFQFTIPQEYGMIMLIPMAIFLFDYINNQKKSDLIFFILSLSLTIGIHFYTGIAAVVLAVAIGLTYLYKIIKEKMLFKLILSGFLSAVLALAPLGIGLAIGHELEQSFTWGAEVIKGDIYGNTSQGVSKEEIEVERIPKITFDEFLMGAKRDLEKHVVHDMETVYLLLFILLLSLLYNIYYSFKKKGDLESQYQIAFAVNSLLLLSLILFKSLGLPTVMEPKRVAIYYAYFSSVFLGMPLEIASRLVSGTKLKKGIPILSIGIIISSVFLVFRMDKVRPLPPFHYFQTTGATLTNMKIMEEYENNTWTIISPVNNITPIMNHGYHYELSTFILEQENWNEKKKIRIPTEYVFLYVEKMPIIKYGYGFTREDPEPKSRPKVTKKDAVKDLSESSVPNYHYINERSILMSKAYYWAEEYKEYFPKEIDVYYEDSELIVYRIKQNINAGHNFSIDYKINKK